MNLSLYATRRFGLSALPVRCGASDQRLTDSVLVNVDKRIEHHEPARLQRRSPVRAQQRIGEVASLGGRLGPDSDAQLRHLTMKRSKRADWPPAWCCRGGLAGRR